MKRAQRTKDDASNLTGWRGWWVTTWHPKGGAAGGEPSRAEVCDGEEAESVPA